MKKNYLILILAGIGLLPLQMKAQTVQSFKQQYLEQAKENAAAKARVTAMLLRKKYNGDAAMEKKLYQVLLDREIAIEQTAVKYSKTSELDNRLAEVIAKNDSIVEKYISAAKNKGLVNNKVLRKNDHSKFAAAIRLRNELSLTLAQVDSLMYHTNRLAELRSDNVDFNPKDYERTILPGILKDGQYTSLLVHTNKAKALKNAQNDWKELQQRGLLPGADSTKVVNEIMKYNIGRSAIADRYGNATSQLSASMKAITSPEPQAAKLLKTARRYNNPISEQPKPAFRW